MPRGRNGNRTFGENLLESVGELSAEKVAKPLGDAVIHSNPGAAVLAAHLQQFDVVMAFAPYIASVLLKNEIPQETVQGFVRGLMQAVQGLNLPNDPKQHKGAMKVALEPVFDKYKDELKQKASSKPKGFYVAYRGLEETKRRVLKQQIQRRGVWAQVEKDGRESDITTEELDSICELPDPVDRLLARLAPVPKRPSFTDRAEAIVHEVIEEARKYKPGSAEIASANSNLDRRHDAANRTRDLIRRGTIR